VTDRRTSIVALLLLGMLLVLPLSDLTRAHVPLEPDLPDHAEAWWTFYVPQRVGGDLLAVLPHLPDKPLWNPKYRTIVLAEAMRRSAGGPIESLVAPEQLALLAAQDPSAIRIPPLYEGFLGRTSAGNLTLERYDPELPSEVIERWRAEGLVTDYPRLVSLVAEQPTGSFVLHVDEDRRVIYAVSAHLSEEAADAR